MSAIPELEALEAWLRTHQDDWPSWLVYADYLTDMGDVRGRLITLEHGLEGETELPRRDALSREIAELNRDHQVRWLAGLALDTPLGAFFEWRHGFVCGVTLRTFPEMEASTIGDLERLLSHPVARFLVAVTFRASLVAGNPPAFGLTGGLQARGAARLARSEHMRTIEHLNLQSNLIGPEGAAALAESEHLQGLASLNLDYNNIRSEGAVSLARADGLRGLTDLRLRANRIGPEGAAALAASPSLAGLRSLAIGINDLGAGEQALEARFGERLMV